MGKELVGSRSCLKYHLPTQPDKQLLCASETVIPAAVMVLGVMSNEWDVNASSIPQCLMINAADYKDVVERVVELWIEPWIKLLHIIWKTEFAFLNVAFSCYLVSIQHTDRIKKWNATWGNDWPISGKFGKGCILYLHHFIRRNGHEDLRYRSYDVKNKFISATINNNCFTCTKHLLSKMRHQEPRILFFFSLKKNL